MVTLTRKLRWALPLALMGAVGCSKVQLPRVGGMPNGQGGGGVVAPATLASGGQSEFERMCTELPGMADVPTFTVAEYPLLIEFVKSLSPLLREDSERFSRAHSRALKASNDNVMALLNMNRKLQELTFFRRRVAQNIRYARPNVATDLTTMVTRVMQLGEGSKCASAYLAHFYANFLKELDTYGDVTFGLTENRAAEDTMTLQPPVPESIRSAPTTRTSANTMVVTMQRWQRSPVLDAILQNIETAWAAQSIRGVMFDLRYATGTDLAIIAQVRASAGRGWGAAPITFWTNRWTKGAAAVLAKQFSTHPNVLVIGSDEETYGFGRRLVQQSTTLVPGTHPVTVTVGSEYLDPVGAASDSENYRFHVPSERILARDSLDTAVDRAEQWNGQAPAGDLSVPPPDAGSPHLAGGSPGNAPDGAIVGGANPASPGSIDTAVAPPAQDSGTIVADGTNHGDRVQGAVPGNDSSNDSTRPPPGAPPLSSAPPMTF